MTDIPNASSASILASTPAAVSDLNASSQTNSTAPVPFDASCYHSWPADPGVMLSLRVYFGTSLVLIVIGLVGNALSIVVFSSREMRIVSSNVYLLSLAVSDSMYLLSILLSRLLTIARCWFFPSVEIDIVNRSRVICVGLQYLTDLFSDYSTCLILAFTVERGLAVFRPITYKERCTVKRAQCVCATMFGVIAACIAPYHVIMIGLYPEYHVCTIIIAHEVLFAAFYLAEQVALRVLPVVAIALLNTLIVVRVTVMTREKNRRRRQMSLQQSRYASNGNGTSAGRNAPVGGSGDVYEMVPDNPTTGRGRNGSVGASGVAHQLHRHRKQKRRASLDERNLQLTIVLILVSSTYILSYLPVLVGFVLQKLKRSKLIDASWEQLSTLTNYASPLHIAGFAINFFLYTVSGRVFRDQLHSIVCGRRRCGRVAKPSGYAHPGPPGGTSSTNAGEPSAI